MSDEDVIPLAPIERSNSTPQATSQSNSEPQTPNGRSWTMVRIRSQNVAVGRRRAIPEDFSTIDWQQDREFEKIRLAELYQKPGWKGKFWSYWDSLLGIWIVILVGISIGLTAGIMNVWVDWISGFRMGYCGYAFWLNEEFCCWDLGVDEKCSDWHEWVEAENIYVQYAGNFAMYMFISMVYVWIAAVLVKYWTPYAAGSGIPEIKTILGGFVMKKFLGVEALVIKVVALILSVGSGLNVGKEGPLVHISSCYGWIIPRFFEKYRFNEVKRRELISAAAASGVAAAFGAPLGGLLFCLEEISYYFSNKTMSRAYFSCLFAVVTVTLVNPFRTGKPISFSVEYYEHRDWHAIELIFFAIVAVLGGLVGGAFIKYNSRWSAYRKKTWIKNWPIGEMLFASFITSLLQYPLPMSRVGAEKLLKALYNECSANESSEIGRMLCDSDQMMTALWQTIVIFFIKFGLFTYTVGGKIPIGVFIPTMTVGALLGRAIGMIVNAIYLAAPGMIPNCGDQCIFQSFYAVVGSAAMLAGVNRVTVSLAVIMLEITGATEFMLPVMLAVIISKWTGELVNHLGLYDQMILGAGYPHLDNHRPYYKEYFVSQVMTSVEKGVKVLYVRGHTIEDLEDYLQTPYFGFPIVQSPEDYTVIGYVSRLQIKFTLDDLRQQGLTGSAKCYFGEDDPHPNEDVVDMRPIMDLAPTVVMQKEHMATILQLFRELGLRYVIVTKDGKLRGILSKKDLLRHMLTIDNVSLSNLRF